MTWEPVSKTITWTWRDGSAARVLAALAKDLGSIHLLASEGTRHKRAVYTCRCAAKTLIHIKCLQIYPCVCMRARACARSRRHTYVATCLLRSKDNFQEWVLSFHVGSSCFCPSATRPSWFSFPPPIFATEVLGLQTRGSASGFSVRVLGIQLRLSSLFIKSLHLLVYLAISASLWMCACEKEGKHFSIVIWQIAFRY